MSFEVQIRKDGDGVAGACVKIEHGGRSDEAITDEDGFARFAVDGGTITLYLDGQRRQTYDYAETQSVTIML